MPWWGWVLIIVGVVALGALKVFFFKRMKKNKKDSERQDHSKED